MTPPSPQQIAKEVAQQIGMDLIALHQASANNLSTNLIEGRVESAILRATQGMVPKEELEQRVFNEIRNASVASQQMMADYEKQITHLKHQLEQAEIRLMCWSGTFQKYQSWKANNVPAADWPEAVVADYEKLSALTQGKAVET